MTKSMEGQDKIQRSESKSLGPGKGHKNTDNGLSEAVKLQHGLMLSKEIHYCNDIVCFLSLHFDEYECNQRN